MKISKKATKGHLIVGAVLVVISLGSMIAALMLPSRVIPFMIFFFGVWGGVELGRYLERWMTQRGGST